MTMNYEHSCMVGVITVASITCRKLTELAVPAAAHRNEFDELPSLAAEVTIGDQRFTMGPAIAQLNPITGMSVHFNDEIQCRLSNSRFDSREGVKVQLLELVNDENEYSNDFSDEEGEEDVHRHREAVRRDLGCATCSRSREWHLLSKPRGEIQVVYYHTFVDRGPLESLSDIHKTNGSTTSNSLHESYQEMKKGEGNVPMGQESEDGFTEETTIAGELKGCGELVATKSSPSILIGNESRPLPVRQRPSTAAAASHSSRNHSALLHSSNSTNGASRPSLPQTVRTITLSNIRAQKLAFSPRSEECLFLSVGFAHQQQQTKSVLGVLTETGHSVNWAQQTLTFEVPSTVLCGVDNTATPAAMLKAATATVRLFCGNTKADGRVIGQATTAFDMCCKPDTRSPEKADGTEELQSIPFKVFFPQMSHSRVHFDVVVDTFEVERELSNHHNKDNKSRPLSASASKHGRHVKPLHGAVVSAAVHQQQQQQQLQGKRKREFLPPASERNNKGNASSPIIKRVSIAQPANEQHQDTSRYLQEIPEEDGGQSVGSDEEIEAFRAQQRERKMELHEQQKLQKKSLEASATSNSSDLTPQESISVAKQLAKEAQLQELLHDIESKLRDSLAATLRPVMIRLEKLDQRVQKTEQSVEQLLLPRIPPGTPSPSVSPNVSEPSSRSTSRPGTAIGAKGTASVAIATQKEKPPPVQARQETVPHHSSNALPPKQFYRPKSAEIGSAINTTHGLGMQKKQKSPRKDRGGKEETEKEQEEEDALEITKQQIRDVVYDPALNNPFRQNASAKLPEGPLCTDAQLRAAFRSYDLQNTGRMLHSQLVHFYRTHNSFAFDEDAEQIEKELRKILNRARNVAGGGRSHHNKKRHESNGGDGGISFEDFCIVALELAKL